MEQNPDVMIATLKTTKEQMDKSIKEYEIIRDTYYAYINGMPRYTRNPIASLKGCHTEQLSQHV